MGAQIMEKERKTCFIITPIGKSESLVRKKVDGLIKEVIKPVLEPLGYEIIVSHEINESGTMTAAIIKGVYNSTLVIANLTGNNPNVLYEVALRHASAKPIIHITENIEELPFDINDQRTIEYTDDMWGASVLKKSLNLMIQEIEFDKPASNPITEALKKKDLLNVPADAPMEFGTLLFTLKDEIKMMRNELRRNKERVNYSKAVYECLRPPTVGLEFLAEIKMWVEEKYDKYAELFYDDNAIKIIASDSLYMNAYEIIVDIRKVINI